MEDFIKMLVLAHCAAQTKMFEDELAKRKDGYKPTTPIWDMLSVAETTAGGKRIADIVTSVLAGVKYGQLIDPHEALYDLIVALTYKTQFYSASKYGKENEAVKILSVIYNKSLDVVQESLYDDSLPSEVTEKVCDLLCD